MGHTLNTPRYVITTKSRHVFSKVAVLCWATLAAILGRRRPAGRRLDAPVSRCAPSATSAQAGKSQLRLRMNLVRQEKCLTFLTSSSTHFFYILCDETQSRQKAFLPQTKAVAVLGTELVQLSWELNRSTPFPGLRFQSELQLTSWDSLGPSTSHNSSQKCTHSLQVQGKELTESVVSEKICLRAKTQLLDNSCSPLGSRQLLGGEAGVAINTYMFITTREDTQKTDGPHSTSAPQMTTGQPRATRRHGVPSPARPSPTGSLTRLSESTLPTTFRKPALVEGFRWTIEEVCQQLSEEAIQVHLPFQMSRLCKAGFFTPSPEHRTTDRSQEQR